MADPLIAIVRRHHRPVMGSDDVRCACGSDSCIPAGRGVWVPLDVVDATEVARARVALTDPALLAEMRAWIAAHGGPDGGEFVAEREDGESDWLYVSDVLAG